MTRDACGSTAILNALLDVKAVDVSREAKGVQARDRKDGTAGTLLVHLFVPTSPESCCR